MAKRIDAGELVELTSNCLCRVVRMDGRSYPTWPGSSYPVRRVFKGTKVLVTGREHNEAWGLMVRFITVDDGIEFQVPSCYIRRVKEQ
mgnify:CR=1 FL=1